LFVKEEKISIKRFFHIQPLLGNYFINLSSILSWWSAVGGVA